MLFFEGKYAEQIRLKHKIEILILQNLLASTAVISSVFLQKHQMNLFITGLPYDVDDQELKELFEEFGEVISAKVTLDRETGKSRGFGFVTMPDNNASKIAMQELSNSTLDGKRLTVKIAEERKSKTKSFRANREAGRNKKDNHKDHNFR